MLDLGSQQLQASIMEASHKTTSSDKDASDLELEAKVKRVTDKLSECIHIVANEPSLGLFRIQEHVRKTLPQLAQTKVELAQIHQKVQGSCYDVDYAINAMKSFEESKRPLSNMETMLKSAIITKKHMNDKVTDRAKTLAAAQPKETPPPRKEETRPITGILR